MGLTFTTRDLLRIVAKPGLVLVGILLGAGAMLWTWKPWRTPPAVARVEMVKPMPRWEPPPRVAVVPPPSPRAEKFEPGPPVCVETLVAETPKADREVRERFALGSDEPILSLEDFPRFPHGGDLAATEEEGKVKITMRAFKAPWFDWSWRHDLVFDWRRLYLGGGNMDFQSYGYEPVELRIKERLRLYPAVGHMEIPQAALEGEYIGITGKLSLGKKERR